MVLNRAGRVLHFNAAAAELAPALRLGEPAQSALRAPEVIATLRKALASGKVQRVDYVHHAPIDRWLELIVTPVPLPANGSALEAAMLMTFHDLTPLRRVEEMRADFVANASHELRTPLASLLGLHRDAAGPGARRCRRRASDFWRSCRSRRRAWRG